VGTCRTEGVDARPDLLRSEHSIGHPLIEVMSTAAWVIIDLQLL
jgi:hypothetical protein